jgi:uncharacterized protein YbaP (TraB family)
MNKSWRRFLPPAPQCRFAQMLKRLLDDRNVTMTEKIEQLVQSGRQVLVVVGAGHLAVGAAFRICLRQRGYRITRVK